MYYNVVGPGNCTICTVSAQGWRDNVQIKKCGSGGRGGVVVARHMTLTFGGRKGVGSFTSSQDERRWY